MARGGDDGPHSIAAVVVVLDAATDSDLAVDGRDPAAHGGVMQAVASVATGGGEPQPAELGIRPVFAAAPCLAGEVRQRGKAVELAALFVELSVTVMPRGRFYAL